MMLFLSTACAPEYSGKTPPPIVDGAIDLTGWDFEKDGPVKLEGEWLFAWEKFVEPASWEQLKEILKHRVKVPGGWDSEHASMGTRNSFPGAGYGTYAIGIRFDGSVRFGVRTESPNMAARLFLLQDNGRPIAQTETGIPGIEFKDEVPLRFRQVMLEEPRLGTLVEEEKTPRTRILVIHVSNHQYEWGGGLHNVSLDGLTRGRLGLHRALQIETTLLGILILAALSHFILFALRRRDQRALFFGVFCLAMAVRQFVMGVAQNSSEWALYNYALLTRLDYISIPASISALGLFLLYLEPGPKFRMFVLGFLCAPGALLVVLTCLVRPESIGEYVGVFLVYTIMSIIGIVSRLFYTVRVFGGVNYWALGAFLVVAAGAINDMLYGNGVIESVFIGPYTTVLFVLLQSGIVAHFNTDAHHRAERLGTKLQEEVELQTLELQEQTKSALRLKAHAEIARINSEIAREEAQALRTQAEADAQRLRELDLQKTAFFQNMSHELRTPLTLILGPLEDELRTQSTNENLSVSVKNARRLLRLVNQLLDFQKLEAGKKGLRLAPVNVSRFISGVGDYFASACSTKAISFHVTRDGQPLKKSDVVVIEAESDALEKAVFNFLSNALKYTPQGGVIELGLLSQVDNQVRLFVKDSGPGISEEGQSKLFEVFSQVEGSTTREYEGTGLGLALVKSLVEEMGGTVGVDSEVGRGSTFFAEFPVIDAETPEHEEFQARTWLLAGGGETGVETAVVEEGDAAEGEGGGELILVVDDLADMRNLIGNVLKKRGYRVLKAANGEQGYEVSCEHRPDLIVSDWMMPKLSGPDMLKRVRENTDIATTPFILLTAKSDEESKLIGTEIGADAFLGKPFSDIELSSMVRNLLALKSREKQAEEQAWLEAEMKLALFADAFHHLNNPLNQIYGGSELLSTGLKDIAHSVNALLTTEPVDPSAEEVRIHYEDRFAILSAHQSLIGTAIARSVDVVKLMRIVSGVDGVPMERIHFGDVCDFLSQRVSDETHDVFADVIDEVREIILRGHGALYGQAIELILRALASEGAKLVKVHGTSKDKAVVIELEFSGLHIQISPELDKAMRLGAYLLKSYKASIQLDDSKIRLTLRVV